MAGHLAAGLAGLPVLGAASLPYLAGAGLPLAFLGLEVAFHLAGLVGAFLVGASLDFSFGLVGH